MVRLVVTRARSQWVKETEARPLEVAGARVRRFCACCCSLTACTGRVLDVRRRGGAALALDIHFADHLITLARSPSLNGRLRSNRKLESTRAQFKEVRNLTFLGFRVPFSIAQPAERAKAVYPLAVSLRETLRAYDAANARLAAEPAADVVPLLVAQHKDATQTLITEGFKLRWSMLPKVSTYVPKLVAGASRSFVRARS